MTNPFAIPPVDDIPLVPTDADHEIVFKTPWEAKAFALVMHLHQRGHFTWPEWTARLGEEIEAGSVEDDGSGYYLLWLAAAEKLVVAKSICGATDLADRKAALVASQGGPAG
ncbi:MAG: nitrile hydratase accessory protein [Gammaproteobacteria bacterium]|nr:nitrile hydratase accessory protein [Gammaproteobacteria bacterium]MCZ6892541.1 nitrile hydratase accessory protein [Gammaproteobacteria bacterium]